jgi:hypothetical protein
MKQSLFINVRAMFTQSWAHGYSLATNQKGVAMIMALLAIAAIAMMGAFGAISAQSELQIAGNEQLSKRALGVSDAGVRHAFRILGNIADPTAYNNGFNDELANGGTGGALGAAGAGVQTLEDGNRYVFFPFGGSGPDGYFVRAVDNFDEPAVNNPTDDRDQRILLIARGRVAGAEKVIQALAAPPVSCALTFGTTQANVGGNAAASDVQINTNEGAGACVHGNGPVTISGNPTFPDGATASGAMTCNGNAASIAGGTCQANALGGQPVRNLVPADIGQMAQRVADLGNANVNGPYFILHTRPSAPGPGQWIPPAGGIATRGGRCRQKDLLAPAVAAPATSQVGLCNGGVPVPMPAGVTINTGAGTCTFDQNTPAGIYYCDGIVQNQGTLSFGGTPRAITFISRDNMALGSQTNIRSFFDDGNSDSASPLAMALANAANNIAPATIPPAFPVAEDPTLPSLGTLSTIGTGAMDKVRNLLIVSGADLTLGGNNDNMTGIILAHNEISLIGGKTITGYIIAGDGLPTYAGDPHPPANIAQDVNPNTVNGNITLNFSNFSTLLPLGPPQLTSWNDDQR